MSFLPEFRSFLTRSNTLALAVGVIIGAAVNDTVSALVDDILMPPVGLLLPSGHWRDARVVLSRSPGADGVLVENALLYGHFLGTLLDLLVVSLVVFFITRWILKPSANDPMKVCTECRESIPKEARRCRACTSPQP